MLGSDRPFVLSRLLLAEGRSAMGHGCPHLFTAPGPFVLYLTVPRYIWLSSLVILVIAIFSVPPHLPRCPYVVLYVLCSLISQTRILICVLDLGSPELPIIPRPLPFRDIRQRKLRIHSFWSSRCHPASFVRRLAIMLGPHQGVTSSQKTPS